MSILLEYDRRNVNAIRPRFVAFPDLLTEFKLRYPYFLQFAWFEKELHDLWMMGPPDPNDKRPILAVDQGRRLLLPSKVHQFAREIAGRVGAEIMTNART